MVVYGELPSDVVGADADADAGAGAGICMSLLSVCDGLSSGMTFN